ncbi:MAG: HTH domain-containing protein [Methanolobus sp.]
MVWKYIKALRKEGYDIRSSPKTGYILDAYPDRVDPDELQKILKNQSYWKGHQVLFRACFYQR